MFFYVYPEFDLLPILTHQPECMPSLPPRKDGQFCPLGSWPWVTVVSLGFELTDELSR